MKHVNRLLVTASLAAMCALGLSACKGSGSPPPPIVHQRLFVANFATGGATSSVVAYIYPLTAASTPSMTLPSAGGPNGASGLALDFADDLFVANASNNTVTAYTPLVGSGSTPAATMTNGMNQPQDITFNNSSQMFVADFGGGTGSVAVYTPQFLNTSVPSFTITTGINGPTGVTFDGVNTIFVANKTAGNVVTYPGPWSAGSAPVVTLTNGLNVPVSVAIDPTSGNLYVANNGNNSVAAFTGTLSNVSTPAFTITTGVSAPRYVEFDGGGLLYVSNAASVAVYQPPLSGTSAPLISLTTGLSTPVGLAIGF